ncbi:hypothetical protein GCM10010387_33210 [Streptomyces inusitatus]|uniref:Uncharacterized protein n=1 Tax=Streptomyces inusitatus TaxID=68221 RepID=A0A918QA95_9ACTN|nr:hypothetical protein [Streptomyces inusitatus]GGZ36507.1 hypothetical protein GCM10010387_33210 [Streptomyces inusitatus]
MRAHRWAMTWRLTARDPQALFAPFDAERCAGVVLLGTHETPGARADDFLAGYRTALPVLAAHIPCEGGPGSAWREREAYRALTAELLGEGHRLG